MAQTGADSVKVYNPEYERWKAAIQEYEAYIRDSVVQDKGDPSPSTAATHSAKTGKDRTDDSVRTSLRSKHSSQGKITEAEERVRRRGGSSFVGPDKRIPEMVLETQVELADKVPVSKEEIHFLRPGKWLFLRLDRGY